MDPEGHEVSKVCNRLQIGVLASGSLIEVDPKFDSPNVSLYSVDQFQTIWHFLNYKNCHVVVVLMSLSRRLNSFSGTVETPPKDTFLNPSNVSVSSKFQHPLGANPWA